MSEQIIHIKVPISRADLDCVVSGLETACGGIRIMVTETFDLIIKDKRQAAALKALFSSNGQTEGMAITPKRGKYKKASKAVEPDTVKRRGLEPGHLLASWEGVGIVEKMTTQAVQKGLAKHSFRQGQKLHHSKQGYKVVVKGENPTDPDQLMDAGEWRGEPL